MTERTLAYLGGVPIERVSGLSGKRGEALRKAGIRSVADLLLHVPRRYIDRSTQVSLDSVPVGEEVTVIVTVTKVSTRRPRRNLAIIEATFTDGHGYLSATWFNQTFRARQLSEGAEVALSGKVERYRGRLQMKSPAVDVLRSSTESLTTGRVVPIHPSVAEVAPGHMRRAIHNALGRARPLSDPLPAEFRERLGLVERDRAIGDIHFPESLDETVPARNRLVFDELFRLEVALALTKQRRAAEAQGIRHTSDRTLVDRFLGALPFRPTGAQDRTMDEIAADLAGIHPMHRLLQGEVGSGKTVVAVATLLVGVSGGYQGAVMAPTEVLAVQHYLGIRDLIEGAGMAPAEIGDGERLGMDSLFAESSVGPTITLALLTSSSAELSDRPPGSASRAEVLEAVADGRADVVIGTHALIQEGVHFHALGVAVVDEQHRFGVHQRVSLKEKAGDNDPDLLIMTATPIPRTLSMTLYGDLDVSILDEMPPGRTPVETVAVGKSGPELERVYRLIRDDVAKGRQAFVVCPLVEDSAKIEAASATAEHERLQRVFPDLRLGLLHGQMRPADKESVMDSMRAGEIDVLVSTTVIEVGIDIPNATLMVIEDAERFGLSQLHQLRGRVGRGAHASTCVLITDPATDESQARIGAMVETTDGFRLAEEDLRIRGQGTVFGARQSGMADLKLADILTDMDTLVTSRREAFGLVAADP
ncbi:MAG: ATP-dependent DNA helicase RecG, partial [Acidimicrobiia bacterium]|nr:ATP-dependent DNA helicase RecG [Acidimicrobiia bacterium]